MYTFPIAVWDELDYEFSLRHDYSGRAMFGTTCIGLTGQLPDLLRFIIASQRIAEELNLPSEELLDALAKTVRSDSMGRGQIFYFPGITLQTNSD